MTPPWPAGSTWGAVASPFARRKYYQVYRTVELQNTFYDLPGPEYAERLRREAPGDFIFNMKAWQALTHPPSSPTWRRARKRPSGDPSRIGLLRPTRENLEAWERVREFATVLGARVVVLQTPPSFRYSPEAAAWVKEFFSLIVPGAPFTVAWEPRGDWNKHRDALAEILCGNKVVHVVDPFKHEPLICEGQGLAYYRLHGRGPGEVNYRYRYTDSDLEELASMLKTLPPSISEAYVMFNNVYMGVDAARFRETARKAGLEAC